MSSACKHAARTRVLAGHVSASAVSGREEPIHTAKVVVEFFFDTSSPWTYLAFSRIREICSRSGAELRLMPFLVGGVFNTANKALYATRDKLLAGGGSGPTAKEKWMAKDLQDWADYTGIDINSMTTRFKALTKSGGPGHPISSVKMMRGALVAEEEGRFALERFALASFAAYWRTLDDVSDDEVIRRLHAEAELLMPLDDFMRRLNSDEIKTRLRANTEAVIRMGGFGSPTVQISRPGLPGFEPVMQWGNDRMELIEGAILRAQGRPWRFHDTCGVQRAHPAPPPRQQRDCSSPPESTVR